MKDRNFYTTIFTDIRDRIATAQSKAILSVNTTMIEMYWDIGEIIYHQQQQDGWGAGVIPKLANDIKNELPEVKGFSERNIGRMITLYREYSLTDQILPQSVAKFQSIKEVISQIPWGHNILLIEKIKDVEIRFWYINQIITNGWSRDTLVSMIKNQVHTRQGNAITNFKDTLPQAQLEVAKQTLKDPYIFDFLTLTEPFQERELELELIKHLEKFLLELGKGFAFLGRQYKLTVHYRMI